MKKLSFSTNPAAFHTQVCVIGAGVLGLAAARALAQAGKEVLIIEQSSHIVSETSSRNSEVLHAGIYYPSKQQPWKARFCVRGQALLYQYCERHGIPVRKCGKLIVGTGASSSTCTALKTLYQQGVGNGVQGLKLLSREDVQFIEPDLSLPTREDHGAAALWSPRTGVFDSHAYAVQLWADAEQHGAIIAFHTRLKEGRQHKDQVALTFEDGTELTCDYVINAAGLWASQVAKLLSPSTASSIPRTFYAKGTYFSVQGGGAGGGSGGRKAPNFHHLIYPLPEPGGLGIHATLNWDTTSTTSNRIQFGPNVDWIDPGIFNDPSLISMVPDPGLASSFQNAIAQYWPNVMEASLVPEFAGIRPKLYHPSIHSRSKDWQLDFCVHQTTSNIIHLLGMESPGLTSSLAIGEHIQNLVLEHQNSK